jgi:hypothetical protein
MGKPTIEDLSNLVNRALRKVEESSSQNAQMLALIAEKIEEAKNDEGALRPREMPQGTSHRVVTLADRLMEALVEPHNAQELAERTGVGEHYVYQEIILLEKRRLIRRTGMIESPRWVRTQGDVSTGATTAEVERFISADQGGIPRSQGELERLTGARRGYVSGALTQLQRHKGAVPMGQSGHVPGEVGKVGQLWWIPPTVSVHPDRRDVVNIDQVDRRAKRRKKR